MYVVIPPVVNDDLLRQSIAYLSRLMFGMFSQSVDYAMCKCFTVCNNI